MERKRWGKWVLLFGGLAAGLLWFAKERGGNSRQDSQQPPAASSESPPTSSSANTLIFAGLSGQPPKFIDSGPERGQGWLEYHTQEIRKGLKQDGFDIQMDYMTPARIAHEFRVQSPICFYPTEWNNPKEVFKQKPDRIYSIPLDLGDEVSQSVMLRKEDLPKFKKHQDSKGNINLESLFQDRTLKTLLVRDKDYGRFSQLLTEVNAQGEQVVRPEYTTHVMLLVVRDNRQIAQMLDAGRFDYTLSSSVEADDLRQSKIEDSRFSHLNVLRTGARDKRDPQLKFVSVACSPHPLAIRAMPFINRWINFYRGNQWKHIKLNYQFLMDSKVLNFLENGDTLVSYFRGEFTGGDLDFWYSDQQKYFPSLKLFPERAVRDSPETPLESASSIRAGESQDLRWSWFTDASGTLTVFSEALPYFDKGTTPNYQFLLNTAYSQRFLPDLLFHPLNPNQFAQLSNERPWDGGKTGVAFEAIPALQVPKSATDRNGPRISKAVFFAHPFTLRQGKLLREWIQSTPLEELSLFGASAEVMQQIIPVLPRSLTLLNLTGSSLIGTSSPEKFTGLKRLHLSDCQLSEPQMAEWLKALPLALEELSLGYNRVAWSSRNVEALSRLQLPRLRLLDLENSSLGSSQLRLISNVLGSQLEVLRLGWNFFTPPGLKALFARPLVRLIELDLSQSDISSDAHLGPHAFLFPSSIKKLSLVHSSLSGKALKKILPLERLEELDLGYTHLEDKDMALLLEGLAGSLVSLRISQGRMGPKGMDAFLRNPRLKSLERLSLDGNNLGNAEMTLLARALPKVKNLSLSRNRISDSGVRVIAETWLPGLEKLNLSYNPITAKGTRELAMRLGKQLKALFLNGLLSIDFETLSPQLPHSLESLALGVNQVSNLELEQLAPHLPKSLQYLDLSKSIFTETGARLLASALPPNLRELDLDSVPIGAEGMIRIGEALPRGLTSLRIGSADLSRREAERLGKALPKALLELELRRLSGSLGELFERLPNSIAKMRMYDSQIKGEAFVGLNQHWPKGLRELYLEGVDMMDATVPARSTQGALPLGLERLALYGENGRLGTLEFLGQCDHLFYLALYRTQNDGTDLSSLFKKCGMLQVVELTGLHKVSRGDWKQLSRMKLPRVKFFNLTNFQGSNALVLDFTRQLSADLVRLNYSFSGLTDEVVKSLLAILPPGLTRLSLRGNPIGQNGLDVLRAYQAKREKEDGMPFQVLE